MYDNSHFEHASSDGTSFGRRLQRFYEGGGIGENIAWGQSGPVDVLASWMTSPGHRCNILSPDWDELGTGYAGARNGRNPYYVQDFGARRGIERHKMAAGVSYVRSARNSRYGVNWYDPQNSFDEPTIVLVRASGCTDLRLKAGLPHQGTYDYVGESDGFPEDYWFLAVDSGGDVHAYPQDGALTTPLPMHSDDAIDDRPMPECAAALLAGTDLPGDDTPDDEVEPDIEEPGAGGDVEPPAQQEDLNPDRRPVRGDTGSSGVLGSGRRGRREEGCAQSTGSVPNLPALLQTLLRR